VLRELAASDKLGPPLDSSLIVHREDLNSRPADRAEADDARALEGEVIRPRVSARMEQRHDIVIRRVDSCQIRSFVQVATIASEREVLEVVRAAVLSRGDVFDVMAKASYLLPQQAVFAAITRALADKGSRGRVHHAGPFEARRRSAFNFRMEMKSSALM
jgi:hypothetical protein